MSKIIILITDFHKHLTFNIGNLKYRGLAKLCFFKLIITKSNFKKISYDVISVMSSLFRHRKSPLN